jgi:hypothetical protein
MLIFCGQLKFYKIEKCFFFLIVLYPNVFGAVTPSKIATLPRGIADKSANQFEASFCQLVFGQRG